MSLEELSRSRIIRKIKPDKRLVNRSIRRAHRDIDTARTLIENKKFDWSLAVSYNSALTAGRALMFSRGYRPSSTYGHIAVVKFLNTSLEYEARNRMIMVLNGMRKKRHRIVYEEMDIVTEKEAEQALKWAEELVKTIDKMINKTS